MRLALISSVLSGIVIVACAAEHAEHAAPPTGVGPGGESQDSTEPPGDETANHGDDSTTVSPARPDAGKVDAQPTQPDASCETKRWYQDSDSDGFGSASTFTDSCEKPSGYVADSTDCDDTRRAVKPGAVELCDAIDNDCDGNVNGSATEAAACTAKAGSYAGTFTLYTAEKVGQTIINQVKCTGTVAITIDLTAASVVKGTATCKYPGSLTAFGKTQSSTIEATVRPDGTLEGKLEHTFDSFAPARTFDIKGTAVNGHVDVTQATSWYPNSKSAVPWELTITIAASKT